MRLAQILILTLVLSLCGCAGYRLGPTNGQKAGDKSVQVTPFANNSPEPGLADEVTSAVRKAVQRDGTFKLATHSDSDLIVTGVITDYRRRELSLLRDDLRTVRDYQITLVAQVIIRERASNRVLVDRTINGTTLLRVGDDFVSSERQASPQLARDLARQITDLLVDGEW
jgi:hypothetical protein